MTPTFAWEQLKTYPLWTQEYLVAPLGFCFSARTTVIQLPGEKLFVHSPGPLTPSTQQKLASLGEIRFIVAPNSQHKQHAAEWKQEFPEALLFVSPDLAKRPELGFDRVLGVTAEAEWESALDQLLLPPTLARQEVVFFHRESKTLLLTDLLENFGDETYTNKRTKLVLEHLLGMWNRTLPPPDFRWGWKGSSSQQAIAKLLSWDFSHVIVGHGKNPDVTAKPVLQEFLR